MRRRWAFVLAGLMPALGALAQEPDFYPYEPEPEEQHVPLLTDSVLFYRAVQTPVDLYGEITDYNLSFVRVQRRGAAYDASRATVEGFVLPVRHAGILRSLGASEICYATSEPTSGVLDAGVGQRAFGFEGEPLAAGRAAAGFTDRNYRAVARLSYTRPLGRGWNLAAAADARTGRDLRIEGVFTHALNAAFRIEKRFRSSHRAALLVVVPPSMRGLRSTSTDEAFALTGDRLYNPAWGYQDGRVRNARIRRECLPFAVLNGTFALSPATDLAVSAGVEAGISKFSTLGWYDARSPLPDNYRYLPSYTGDRETDEAWRTADPRYTQVDWDALYARNRRAGGEALYALEDRVERRLRVACDALFTTRLSSRLTLRYGLAAHYESVRHYKQMRDLLGAGWLTDIDQFLIDDDTYSSRLQNDLRHPSRRIRPGNRFGYDYAFFTAQAAVRMLVAYRSDRFRADAGIEAGSTKVYRRGYYEKELFPGNRSYGRSAVLRFTPYVFKASAGWAFSPRTYAGAMVTAAASVPRVDALFLQPQYNNRAAEAPTLRKTWAAEAVCTHTGRTADLRVAAFFAVSRDGMAAYRYYDDLAGAFCNMTVHGIGMRSYGMEAAAALRLSYRWQLLLAASVGQYEYATDPRLSVVTDTDHTAVDIGAVSHMGGCRAGNAPQATACAEVAYFGPKGWGFRCGANYAGMRYAEPAFLRRTERVARQAAASPEAFARFTEQERLGDAWTFDVSAYRTFYFGASRLTVWLAVRNLLGTNDTIYAAYESLRVRRSRSGDFYAYAPAETRRTYAYPRSFYVTISYRF